MTPQALPTPLVSRPFPLRRGWPHWWARWQQLLAQRRLRRQALALRQLPAHVLCDIGAPDWLREAAAQERGRQAMDRELLRRGIVVGAPW